MKVALTIWQERISPVFDSAQMLLIADIQDSKVTKRRLEPFFPARPKHLVDRLNELKVKVVICGAITEVPAIVIEAGGIELIPFIGGLTEEILGNYARGIAIIPKFLMPGCDHRGRRQKKKTELFQGCKRR
jgi:predicted Fe-Mo cluster-binding NifX family protein